MTNPKLAKPIEPGTLQPSDFMVLMDKLYHERDIIAERKEWQSMRDKLMEELKAKDRQRSQLERDLKKLKKKSAGKLERVVKEYTMNELAEIEIRTIIKELIENGR